MHYSVTDRKIQIQNEQNKTRCGVVDAYASVFVTIGLVTTLTFDLLTSKSHHFTFVQQVHRSCRFDEILQSGLKIARPQRFGTYGRSGRTDNQKV